MGLVLTNEEWFALYSALNTLERVDWSAYDRAKAKIVAHWLTLAEAEGEAA